MERENPWPAGSSLGRYSVKTGSSVSHPTGLTGQYLQGLSLKSAWCLHMVLVKKYWPQGTTQLKSQEILYRLFPLVCPLRPDPFIQAHPSIVPHIQAANTSRRPRQELKSLAVSDSWILTFGPCSFRWSPRSPSPLPPLWYSSIIFGFACSLDLPSPCALAQVPHTGLKDYHS